MTREYKIATMLIEDAKYLHTNQILGVYAAMTQNYGCKDHKVAAEAIFDVIIDQFFGGCEPDFASMEAHDWFMNFNSDYIQTKTRNTLAGDVVDCNWASDYIPPSPLFSNN